MLNFKLIISSVTAIMLLFPNMTAAGDIVIIGNKSIAESSLNKQDLKNIYLGRKTAWSDKKRIIFVTLDNKNVSEEFLDEYLNMISAQYANHWLEKVYTGQGTPPRTFASDEEMIRFIADTDGAIGYVTSSDDLNGVKIFAME